MGMIYLFQSIGKLFSPMNLITVFLACQLGIIFGMLPGITATMGIALLTTVTFKWSTGNAIMTLLAVYVGAIYGGSRSAIVLNIPGTPASAATCLDGYPLAQSGRGAEAIGLATTSSFLGSFIGLLALSLLTPILGNFALDFKSFEMFWLAIFGVAICGNLTAPKDPIKGWISGILGILLAFCGMEAIQGYPRFTFGILDLYSGFSLIPVMVGTYGLAEILLNLAGGQKKEVITEIGRVVPRLSQLLKHWFTIIRSGIIGIFIGIVPGVGESIASFVSYDFAKRASKHPEEYGKGSVEGLIAAETANNACTGGALIPVLSLAIPGSAPAAVLLAALWLHNVRPGPLIMIEYPKYIYEFSAMFFYASVAMVILGLLIVKPLLRILRVRNALLMPIIFIFCIVGTYAISGRIFDIGVMVVMGVIGFIMAKHGYPAAPLVLALILGPMVDENLRRGLILTNGDFLPFVRSPISIVLVIAIFFTLFGRTKPMRAATRFVFRPVALLVSAVRRRTKK
jgi:putative tricarboxylic transport membrane protein